MSDAPLASEDSVDIVGPPVPRSEEILTADALDFVADMHRQFQARRAELLRRRQVIAEQTAARKAAIAVLSDLIGKPIDPAQIAKDIARIDSLYQSEGYYLAKVTVDSGVVQQGQNARVLTFRVTEGRRLAIAGVEVEGNKALSDADIVGAITTKPEGFFWWRNGEFDSDKYAEDLAKNIPALYAAHGFIDMQIVKDTLIVDRNNGKAMVESQYATAVSGSTLGFTFPQLTASAGVAPDNPPHTTESVVIWMK